MRSRSPDSGRAGALLARKLELLESLSGAYERALCELAAADLGRAAELVDDADRLVEDLAKTERTLGQLGITTPESLHATTSEVRALHGRLCNAVQDELAQTREERRRVAAFRGRLASRLESDRPTGSLVDSRG